MVVVEREGAPEPAEEAAPAPARLCPPEFADFVEDVVKAAKEGLHDRVHFAGSRMAFRVARRDGQPQEFRLRRKHLKDAQACGAEVEWQRIRAIHFAETGEVLALEAVPEEDI